MVRLQPFPGVELVYSKRDDGSIDSAKQLLSFFTNGVDADVFPVVLGLTHEVGIAKVTCREPLVPDVDAAMTAMPAIALSMRIADCLPIVLYDRRHDVVALVHGSWRTLLQSLLELTLLKMKAEYDTQLEELEAWIGPSIGACCNRLAKFDVHSRFSRWTPYIEKKKDGFHLNLQRFVGDVLQKNGVKKEHIINTELCTYHLARQFFSHRRSVENDEPDDDGRMMFAVWRMHD
jgi:YfiH family protein